MPVDTYNFSKYALTEKQGKFLENYLITFNEVESVQAAYDCKSRHNAIILASQLLKNEKITKVIKDLLDNDSRLNQQLFSKMITRNLFSMGFFDISEIVNDNGELKKPLSKLSKSQQLCIQGLKIKYNKAGEKYLDVQFVDRIGAINLAAKVLQLYNERASEPEAGLTDETIQNLKNIFDGKE